MSARWLSWLLALVLLALVRSSFAQAGASAAGERRVVVGEFRGKQAKAPRSWLISALEAAGFDVVPKSDAFERGEPSTNEELVAVAREHRLSAVVSGELQKVRRGYQLTLSVRNGTQGDVVDEVELRAASLAKLKQVLAGKLPQRLTDALQRTAAPAAVEAPAAEPAGDEATPAPTPAPPAATPDEESPAEPDAGTDDTHALLELMLGLRGYSRNLTYNDDLFDRLAVFRLGAAPAAFARLRLYPLATAGSGFIRHVGIAAGYAHGFATTMTDVRDRELEVSMREFYVGLRTRLPVERHELGVMLAYGQHELEIAGPSGPDLVPDVAYSFLRAGLDARFRAGSFVVGFHGGYRLLLSMGAFETDEWFPQANGAAVEAGAFVGQSLSDAFELHGGLDFVRYFFSLNPEPGDRHIAGGALDQYLSLWAGVLWRWPDARH